MKKLAEIHLQAYKREHKSISFWLGNKFFVGIAGADEGRAALKYALDKPYVNKITKHLVGDVSLFAPVEIWDRKRKILVPSFASRHVINFVTVFEAHSKVAAELFAAKVGMGNFSCFEYIALYNLDSVCETLFGVKLNVLRQPDHPFLVGYTQWLTIIATRLCKLWLHIDCIYKLLPMYGKQEAVTKILHGFVDNLIYKKKQELMDSYTYVEKISGTNNQTNKSNLDFKPFLKLMRDSSNETDKNVLTNKELREESIGLMLAATDTTAVGTSFTLLLLSQHPDIQDKVYKEIREVLGDSNKPLQAENLLKLKYTIAVIKESLRLYPPSPFIVRCCRNNLELPSGLVIPGDCDIIISILGIQRNPEYWGEDANDLNPDRFMSELSTPNAFLSFGYSARNCVGQQYAMLSMTTTLVTMLRRYRFTPATNFKYDKNNPLRLSFDFMLKHVDNFSVQIENRT